MKRLLFIASLLCSVSLLSGCFVRNNRHDDHDHRCDTSRHDNDCHDSRDSRDHR